MYPTTITQKGQVTIPKKIRKHFGIESYDTVIVEPAEGYIKIIPNKDILSIAGTFKPKKRKPLLKAREQFEKNYKRV